MNMVFGRFDFTPESGELRRETIPAGGRVWTI
jgi:hypothetical protein